MTRNTDKPLPEFPDTFPVRVDPPTMHRTDSTPVRLMVLTTACVFVAEALIMILLSSLPPLGMWITIFFDATLIVLFVLPVLYFSLFKPLQQSLLKRIQTEQSARVSENKFRSYTDSSPYAMIVADKEGSIVDVNDAIMRISGYSREELLKMNISGFFPDNERQEGIEHFSRVLKTGKSSGIVPVIIKSGAKRYWEIEAVALSENRILGFMADVTPRLETASALKESEEKYRNLVETSQELIWKCDAEGRFIYLNPAWEKTHGYKLAEMLGRPFTDFQTPEVAARDKEEFGSHLAGGSVICYETSHIAKSGKTIHLTFAAIPLYDNNGNITGTQGTAHDITERKRAEEALKESEEKYRLVFETAANLITSVDSEGTLKDCNNRMEEVLGYTRDEMIGQNMGKIIHPDYRSKAQESLTELVATGTAHNKVYKMVRKDSRIIDVNVNSSSITDEQGHFIRSICIIDDITETKRLEALESRAARLETAGTIAGQVAHDFNNLLAPIMAYPELIRDALPADSPLRAYTEEIEYAAQKIADINQDLLTMGRRGHYIQEVLDLNVLVRQTAQEMELGTNTVTVEMDLCQDLMNIKGGIAQIHRMLINLLVNAQDAISDIGKIFIKTENYRADDISVAFGRVPKGEYVKLTVSDNGCGIAEDVIENILDPFFSTKTADKKRGSGLGLSIVDAVMKDHDGYLDMASKVGQGTSFYLYFPVTRDDITADEFEDIAGGKENILIVDDDKIQREVTSQLLTKLGYNVSSVESGEIATEFIRDNPQNLAILDMVMVGGIDGTETYRRMLEFNPDQKAILLSGYSESDRVIEAQQLGAGAFVRKPVTKSVIATAVRCELDRQAEVATH